VEIAGSAIVRNSVQSVIVGLFVALHSRHSRLRLQRCRAVVRVFSNFNANRYLNKFTARPGLRQVLFQTMLCVENWKKIK